MVRNSDIDTALVLCEEREMYKMFEQNVFDTLSIPCNNVNAVKIFKQKISKLKGYIEGRDSVLLNEINNIMLNFVLLTTIESENSGDWTGILIPTNNDIEQWEKWFQKYKDHICWYEQKKVLFLRKCE